MHQSLSYYIVRLVLKLKGIKKDFSQAPVDYKKVRKGDVYQPTSSAFGKRNVNVVTCKKTNITQISGDKHSDQLILFIHGGAFISGPAQHHWNAAATLVEATGKTLWMCNYPKAPEHQIGEMSVNINAVYSEALQQFKASNICLIGDSVGGTLATALTQRLLQRNQSIPNKLILITPVMDASLSNPEIAAIAPNDPMLSVIGIRSAKRMCAGSLPLQDERLSPLYGSFKGFPKTLIYAAEHDIMYPDAKLAAVKMREQEVDIEVIEGQNMPHIWPLLPIMKEAKESFTTIVNALKANT